MLKKYGVLLASILVALVVVPAGGAKLAGVPQVHQSFALLGLPGWFGYLIGACEIAGGIALFIRPLSALAAAGLVVIMLGAVYFHVTHPPLAAGIPAFIVLLLSGFIFSRRRASMLAFGGSPS
jgi:putative oxidoreductase